VPAHLLDVSDGKRRSNGVPWDSEAARAAGVKSGEARRAKSGQRAAAKLAYKELIKERMADLPDASDLPDLAEQLCLMMISEMLAGKVKPANARDAMAVAKTCFEITRLTREQPTTITESMSREAAMEQFEALRKQAEQRLHLRSVTTDGE
jgi:hypothetical protein